MYLFISLLYMFWATQCSSSGESIVSVHHLVYITLCRWLCGMPASIPDQINENLLTSIAWHVLCDIEAYVWFVKTYWMTWYCGRNMLTSWFSAYGLRTHVWPQGYFKGPKNLRNFTTSCSFQPALDFLCYCLVVSSPSSSSWCIKYEFIYIVSEILILLWLCVFHN
jgi:hypothetical protein